MELYCQMMRKEYKCVPNMVSIQWHLFIAVTVDQTRLIRQHSDRGCVPCRLFGLNTMLNSPQKMGHQYFGSFDLERKWRIICASLFVVSLEIVWTMRYFLQ